MIAAAGGGGEIVREIILRLRMENDPSNVQAAAAAATAGTQAHNRITQAATASAAQQVKLANGSASEQVKAQKNLAKEYETQTAKMQAAQFRMIDASKKVLGGITALARGITILGVVGEKDLEKVVRTLAKFEAGVQIMKGLVDIVVGGTKAWKAYQAAVAAAAATQVAAGALGAGGAAKQAAGGAAGGIAGGVAGGAAVAGAGRLAGLVGAATSPIGLAAVGVAAAALGKSLWDLMKATDAETKSRERLLKHLAKEEEADNRATKRGLISQTEASVLGNNIELVRNRAGRGLTGPARDLAKNEVALRLLRGELSRASSARQRLENPVEGDPNTPGGQDILRMRAEAADKEISIAQQVKQVEQERLAINQQILQKKIEGHRAETDSLKTIRDQVRAEQQGLEGQVDSAMQRFGRMSPGEQARLIAAKKAVDAGTATRRQRDEVDQLGLESLTAKTKEMDIAAAIKGGFEAAGFGRAEEDRAADLAQRAHELSLTIDTNNELTIKLEADSAKMIDELESKLEPIFKDINKAFFDALAAKLAEFERKMRNERTAREINQGRGAG